MRKIKNLNLILTNNADWTPVDIAYIKSFELNDSRISLTCLSQSKPGGGVWPNESDGFLEIAINFEQVSKLRINFPGIPNQAIAGFNIIDISENGWENVNFSVEDYEDDRVAFYCKEIIVLSVNAVTDNS